MPMGVWAQRRAQAKGNSNNPDYLKKTIHVMSRCLFEPPVPYTVASVDTAEHRNWCRCSLEEHPRGIQQPTQEVQGLRVELGSGQLGNHLLHDDEEDGDHSQAAVVELGVLLGDELVLRQLGPWASRKGGTWDQQKAILLLRNLDTRNVGHANVSMCLYECDTMGEKNDDADAHIWTRHAPSS